MIEVELWQTAGIDNHVPVLLISMVARRIPGDGALAETHVFQINRPGINLDGDMGNLK